MVILPHNYQAYENVSEAFKVSDRACIIHATGTGKSFVIMAVAGDYQRVLIIAPNNYVLNEIQKRNIPATFATYSAIMGTEHFPKDEYDLIVLDEFHRAGALKWGDGIQKLIEANPHAKMLGTSATEIRYLDNGRDMADELFENNVVSRITLADAWARGILRVPKYITGLYSFDNIDREYRERIDNSRRSDSEKMEMKDMLDRGRLDWVSSKGIAGILKKHLDKDTKRMIVFCDSIDNLDEQKAKMTEWLQEAGFRSRDYVVHSRNGDSEKQMSEFENTEFDGIKVMYSVNMLNEGVHVPGVDAVVMLRPTQSKTIYLQQMGRCLSAGAAADRQPVVFDFVDNLSSTKEVETLRNEFLEKRAARKEKTPGEIVEVRDFLIEDNLRSLNDVIEIIEGKLGTRKNFEERIQELREWINENKRWPNKHSKDPNEKSLNNFAAHNNQAPQIQELQVLAESLGAKKIKTRKQPEERLKELHEWIIKNERWPSKYSKDSTENTLGIFVTSNKDNPRIQELKALAKSLGAKTYGTFEERIVELQEWINENKRWPKNNSKDSTEKTLACFVGHKKDNPKIEELKTLAKSLGARAQYTYEERLEELRSFIIENRRLPSRYCNNRKEKSLAYYISVHHSDHGIQELKALAKSLGAKTYGTFEERIVELQEWIKENKRWPKQHSKDSTEKSLAHFAGHNNQAPQIQELQVLAESLGAKKIKTRKQPEERLKELHEWIIKNERWPKNNSKDSTEKSLAQFAGQNKDNPKIGELKTLAKSLGAKTYRTSEERIVELQEWINENKRWPKHHSKDSTEQSLAQFAGQNKDNPKIGELKTLVASLGPKAPKSSNGRPEILTQNENFVKGGDDAFHDESQKVLGQNTTPTKGQKVEIFAENDVSRQNIEKGKTDTRKQKEIKPISEDGYTFRRIAESAISSGKIKSVGELKDGWALVQSSNGKFNYANSKGGFMTKNWFDSATEFSNGVATIRRNGCTAKINRDGIAVEVVNNIAQKTGSTLKIR